MSTVRVALLLLLYFCISIRNARGSDKISISVYANTLVEIDGISAVPAVFGLTAYNGVEDFSSAEGVKFLSEHHIDTVGFGTTLSSLLPTGTKTLPLTELQNWFTEGNAYKQYKTTSDYAVLLSQGIRRGGASPFLFVRNPLGYCSPYCQQVNCLSRGGTPKAKSINNVGQFKWWINLITGYLSLALKVDPGIDTIHIWDEPDSTFWKDGKNGSYYTKFYRLTASVIKSKWPSIKIGGPVSSAPSTDYQKNQKNLTQVWYTYIKPFIDSTARKGLLDFLDFHAFDDNITPANMLHSIETVTSYAYVKYRMYIPVAITETNIKSISYSTKKEYFLKRTFPLLLSTFALLRNPGMIVHRLLFDYKGTSKCQGCKLFGNSPESFVYKMLGKLGNGSRIHMTIDGGQYMTSGCHCYSSTSTGGQPIIGEAVMIDTNVTIALLNTCNCPITIKINFIGSSNSAIKYSWAAILNYRSVVTTNPVEWSSSYQTLVLSSHSLYVASYEFSTRYSTEHFPFIFRKNPSRRDGKRLPVKLTYIHQARTAFPTKAKYIMMPMPSQVPCGYVFTVDYDVSLAMSYLPKMVYIKLGFIGNPGSINWSATWKCSTYSGSSREILQIISPAQYYMSELPCIPYIRSNGYVRIHFKATNKCHSYDTDDNSSSTGYLAFTSLVYVTEIALYS